MVDREFRNEVRKRLEEQYGTDRIKAEPNLPGQSTVYPDFCVFQDQGNSDPFLLVECSSFRTSHRRDRDFGELYEAVTSTNARYGAFVGPNVEFVFSVQQACVRSYGGFPAGTGEIPEPRPLQSQEEFKFLLERVSKTLKLNQSSDSHSEVTEEDILYALQLIIVDFDGLSHVDSISIDQVRDAQEDIGRRHDSYSIPEEVELKTISTVARVFSGYNLQDTSEEHLSPLFGLGTSGKQGDEHTTPVAVADEMVRLTGPESGETVLDPAAGQGTILIRATSDEVNGVGVELNPAVASLATAYADIFGREIDIHTGDFLSESIESDLPGDVENVIIDPPFGGRFEDKTIPYFDRDRPVQSEEAFLAKSLSLVSDGGRVTIAIPASFLHQHKFQWIRQKIVQDFCLESIVQVTEGPLYRSTSIDVAFLTVAKEMAGPNHGVKYALVNESEAPEKELKEAITEITAGTAQALPQSEFSETFDVNILVNERRSRERLNQEFEEVVPISEIAEPQVGNQSRNIHEGNSAPSGGGHLPYLRIRDVSTVANTEFTDFLSRDDARVVADETWVLVSALGEKLTTYIPTDEVAPARDWIALKFDTHEQAFFYEAFLNSSYGREQLETIRKGAIPRINVRDIERIYVPLLDEDTLRQRVSWIKRSKPSFGEFEDQKWHLQEEERGSSGRLDGLIRGVAPNE